MVNKVYLTAEGARVSAYCQNNDIAVKFTEFGIGSGENYNPAEATKMTDKVLTVPIQSCVKIAGDHYRIRGEFVNEILESDLVYRELCLYCEDPENEGEKVMYCYGNAKGTDFDYTEIIPAFTTGGNQVARIVAVDTFVAGGNATFYVDNLAKADIATVQSLRDDLEAHKADTGNPHSVTAEQLGLGNVDNTADADKSVNHAESADLATQAEQDADGNIISVTYATKEELSGFGLNIASGNLNLSFAE